MIGMYLELHNDFFTLKILSSGVLKCWFSIVYAWFLVPLLVFIVVYLLLTPSFRKFITTKFMKFINFFRKKQPNNVTMKFVVGPAKSKNDK